MRFASLFTLIINLYVCGVYGVTWYFLEYNPSGSGQYFTEFSGTMEIPTLPQAGVYYLWPGLQPTDNSGVYQNVLDGRSGTWWLGSGWCCSNPSLAWGSGFNIDGGDTATFSNVKGTGNWTSTLTKGSTGDTVTDNFALTSKNFNQAIFAIELYDETWDFGSLTFTDVTIVATGSDSSTWCDTTPTNYNNAAEFTVSGATATVSGTTVTCHIDTVELIGPA
ncbi:MAG: hypothetical protein M1834_000836 [Cirrosporium novae-zelandiae]|nr:MAG: hypothetical protein M1834_000836 [Cirrosporium novae-zelandiae]